MAAWKKYTILLFTVFFLSCRGDAGFTGSWENELRLLSFRDGSFSIENRHSEEVTGFRGTYSRRRDTVRMVFQEYSDSESVWHSVEGTGFEGFIEELRYTVSGDELRIYIPLTGKDYYYRRTGN